MNIEEYISSGTLEAYVMDQLSEAERAEVEHLSALHAEVSAELEQIELSMESLALSTAISPPIGTKEKLLSQINSESKKETPVIAMQADRAYGVLKYAAAASIAIAVFSSVMAYTYWKKWQSTEVKLTDLIAQNARFAENYNQVNLQLDDIQSAVAIMNSPAYKRVTMNGTDNAPNSLATIYWNEESADVYLSIQNLKKLSKNQQYQLWAIIDGKPTDAGVFDSNSNKLLIAMKSIGSDAAAFAVTIEPHGGSENPSLETMQVLGSVSS